MNCCRDQVKYSDYLGEELESRHAYYGICGCGI